MKEKGFTMLEVLCALTVGAIAVAIVIPGFSNVLRRSRLDAAVRQVVLDVREARARAVSTGWEYRVVGYGNDEDDADLRNQYRLLARRSSVVDWPAEDSVSFESATQLAENWIDLQGRFPGVTLGTADPRFELTFDARGSATAGEFNPLTITGHDDEEKSLTVSVVGSIRIE